MKKIIIRSNETFIFDSFARPLVSAVLGPRRVGKTTLVTNYMRQHPRRKWVQLNMDILEQRNRIAAGGLEALIEQGALQRLEKGAKIWVFIDEAQKCPELFDQVKLIFDRYKDTDAVKFILTGSAHLNLHQLTAESLAGRVELLYLREFNLKEMALLKKPDLLLPNETALHSIFNSHHPKQLLETFDHLRPFQHLLEHTLEEQLIWGGLPETITEPSEKYRLKYLGDYLQTYLEKDVRAIASISDLHLFQGLMKICAELTGSLRDDKKIIDALHCSRNTLAKYRGYLSATLQYLELYPYVGSTVKRLVKSPKGYLINNGLISYLTGIHDISILKTTGLVGHRFENWVLNEIQCFLDTATEIRELSFWRTTGGSEVDLVVRLGSVTIPIEITYSPQPPAKKIRNLRSFIEQCPDCPLGVICYTGPYNYDQETSILYLPAWML